MEMRERLKILWERLEEPINNRNAFLNVYQGYSRSTEKALVDEIERCEERKRQRLQVYIIFLIFSLVVITVTINLQTNFN